MRPCQACPDACGTGRQIVAGPGPRRSWPPCKAAFVPFDALAPSLLPILVANDPDDYGPAPG